LNVTAIRGPLGVERRGRYDKGSLVGRVLLGKELLGGGARDLAGAALVEVETHPNAEGSKEKDEDAEHECAPSGSEAGDVLQRSESTC
jgi:hypothetical protein